MTDYSKRTVCIFDNGLFPHLAETLAASFGKTYYYSTWESPFPRSNAILVGEGLPGVTRINSIWPVLDEIDLFVFPDIFHGPLQVYLQKLGKRVWGARLGENLEILRGLSKRWFRDVGLAVGPHRQIRGLDKLREFLKENEDQYVKISRTRGDMETFHAKNYKLIEPRLDELEHALGAKKNIMDFVVEAGIECKAEVGYDGYCIDGKFASVALYGVEAKDQAYLGQVVPYQSLPGSVQSVNAKLRPLFQKFDYRGFWSSEIRIAKDDTPYLIDPCCRMASPPGELYQYMIENLADVIWNGAHGEMVEPKFKDKWGAELIIKSPWAEANWQPIEFPNSVRENVKLHYHTMIGGKNYYVPQNIGMVEVGAVVSTGSTPEEAIKNVTRVAEKVEGYDIKFSYEALDHAKADMQKLKNAA